MRVVAVVFVLCLALVRHAHALNCQPCQEVACSYPKFCKFGTVKDICGCCAVCAQGQGLECGGPFGILGQCAEGLECKPKGYINPVLPPQYQEGNCVPILAHDQPPLISKPAPAPTPALTPASKPQVKTAPVPAVVFKPSYGPTNARRIHPQFMRAPYKSGSRALAGSFSRRNKAGHAPPKAKNHKVSVSSSNIPAYILKRLQQRKRNKKAKDSGAGHGSPTSSRTKRSPQLLSRKAGRSRLQAKHHKLRLSGMNIPQEVLEKLRALRPKRSPRMLSRKAGRSRLQAKHHKLNLSGMNIPQEVLERLKALRPKRSPRMLSRKAGRSRLQARLHKLNLSGMNIPQEVLQRLKALRPKRSPELLSGLPAKSDW